MAMEENQDRGAGQTKQSVTRPGSTPEGLNVIELLK